ncbi:uncharacterized protein LOC112519529 [Cynara cardunculus var. scolymus]|uniref:Pollen Ole e 1 allergen/extensin n=1 Tax=Cynara cardunculus var. scolymus TaxID=59895 RepID=A0A124SEG8_CYNCS|nr:uncharacterized protein LOC112519529 [Cynara cardunculus var. scolymus]KVI00073.1 Pollen Ole e 1 allergen/extensin [Cynara cardunculus var. scolymus]
MAATMLARMLLFVLALSIVEFSTSHVLKSSVNCLDCLAGSDLAGIKILVKCKQVKNLAMATTNEHGAFETQLPSSNCEAKIMGGPKQLYISRNTMVTSITDVRETDSYTTSRPLSFYTSCPLSQTNDGKCGATNDSTGRNVRSSKTVDLPLPREWGLAPSSYYVPFVPIIGIP